MPMVFDLSLLRTYLHKPFAVKLDELLPRMMLLSKRYIAMSAKDEHRNSAGQAVADDYDVIRIVPCRQWLQFAKLTTHHGAISIALRFTYSLR